MPSKDLPRFALDAVAVVKSHRAFRILLTPRFGSTLISVTSGSCADGDSWYCSPVSGTQGPDRDHSQAHCGWATQHISSWITTLQEHQNYPLMPLRIPL